MNRRQLEIKEGPIGKTLINMSLPMMVGLLGVVSLNIIDAYFVGKLGTEELAAIGYTFPAVLLQGAISGGLGVGASAVISRAIGSGNKKLVKKLTTHSLLLSLIIVLIMMVLGELTIKPFFSAMGADSNSLNIITQYMKIWYLGLPFVVIPMVGNGAIRATGNTLAPAVIMVMAMVINIILDPIFIFGYGPVAAMGIKGAAIATVISRSITMVFSILYLSIKLKMISFELSPLKIIIEHWKKILTIALPAGLTQIFVPLSMGFIMRLVSQYGINAVAAMGMGTKIEMFALVPARALSVIMIPFVGQNAGAKNYDRIERSTKLSFIYIIIYGIILFGIFVFLGKWIGSLFDPNPEVIELIYRYLFIVSIGFGFRGFIEIGASIFNALQNPIIAAATHITRMAIFYIPLALLAINIFAIDGIFYAASLSSILTGVLCFIALKIKFRKKKFECLPYILNK